MQQATESEADSSEEEDSSRFGSESDTEGGDSGGMEEGSRADWEGEREHASGTEDEVNDDNDPVVEQPSEAGDSEPANE